MTKRGRGRPSKEQPGADRRAAEVDRERLVRELEIHQVELEMQNEELRQAQESLAASLRHVSDLYDHAPVGYATLDQETSILEINLAGAAMLGRPVFHAKGTRLWGYVARGSRDAFDGLMRSLRKGAPEGCDVELACPDGGLHVHMQARLGQLGGSGQEYRLAMTDISDRVLAEKALRRSREELRAIAGRLRAVREAEQERIARDLHDDLGQILTGLGLALRMLERRFAQSGGTPGWVEDWVVSATELVDQAQSTVHRVASDLRPQALTSLGLGPALLLEARRFEARYGARCQVRVADEVSVSPDLATTLYRIAQESLTNVARHANATQVTIRVEVEGGAVVMRVEDDGRGPLSAEGDSRQREGLGLLGMRERAVQFGGELRLERRAAGGAVVIARLPLAAGAGEDSLAAARGPV